MKWNWDYRISSVYIRAILGLYGENRKKNGDDSIVIGQVGGIVPQDLKGH